MTDKPHNNLFQYTFSDKNNVKDLLINFLKDLSDKLDLTTLAIDNTTYISEQLKEFYSDIVYQVETKEKKKVKVALLFEHKSSPPQFPHLQLLDYMLGIWRYDVDVKKKPKHSKRLLTPVIPIFFYHGKEKWKKKAFSAYFPKVDNLIQNVIPTIEYYIIDLADYDDDFILSLKAGFIINSLLAFKHKNDTVYVRKYFARIFINLERHLDSDVIRNFTLALSVYIVTTTRINSKEIIELVEKLPKKTKSFVMTGYESLLLEGEKRGIQKGKLRNEQENIIETALKLLSHNMSDDFIIDITGIDIDTLSILRTAFADNFKTQNLQLQLAKHLILHFKHLENKDIAAFAKLEEVLVQTLKSEIV